MLHFFAAVLLSVCAALVFSGCGSAAKVSDGTYLAKKTNNVLSSFLPYFDVSQSKVTLHLNVEVFVNGTCRENTEKHLLTVTLDDKSEMQFAVSGKKLTLQPTSKLSETVSHVYQSGMVFEKAEPVSG